LFNAKKDQFLMRW